MNRENRFEEFRGRKRKEELIIVHRILSWKEHGGYVSNFREVNSRHHLVEQSGLMGREIRQGSKVVAFERIRRKHSAEQEDRCGILYQQLVAGHLRRDGGSFGVSADAAKAALAFYEYIYIYILYIYIEEGTTTSLAIRGFDKDGTGYLSFQPEILGQWLLTVTSCGGCGTAKRANFLIIGNVLVE